MPWASCSATVGLYDLDAIFLSHLHADHCIDMCAYFVARYYRHDGGRCAPIPVYGPEGTEQRLTTAYADTPSDLLHERGLRLPHAQAEHLRASARSRSARSRCATRSRRTASGSSTPGRRSTYSGDTGVCEALERTRRGTPTCSSARPSFTHGKEDIPDLHLNGREAGETANRAGARTARPHPHPAVDRRRRCNLADAREVYDGPVELAAPGAVVRDLRSRVRTAEAPDLPRGTDRGASGGQCRRLGYLASAFCSSSTSSSGSRPGVGRLNLVIAKRKTT